MGMGSPDYPDDPADLKPPSTVSLPMHGMDENNSDSDDNDGIPSNNDPYVGYQQLNLEDVPDDNDDDDDDDDEDISNVQVNFNIILS